MPPTFSSQRGYFGDQKHAAQGHRRNGPQRQDNPVNAVSGAHQERQHQQRRNQQGQCEENSHHQELLRQIDRHVAGGLVKAQAIHAIEKAQGQRECCSDAQGRPKKHPDREHAA